MEQKGYRLLVDVYKVPVGFGPVSSEETENGLNRDRDYFCQFQADTVQELLNKIGKYNDQAQFREERA